MILDLQNLVSDKQDLAQTNATYLSTYSIDLGATGTIPGLGGSPISDPGRADVEFLCQVVTAFATSASGTLRVDLVMADDAALTSNLTVLKSTPVLAAAALTAGLQLPAISGRLPPGISKRYLGLQYVIGTGAMSAGKITAGVLSDRQSNPTV